jgi:hypothetical protein
VETLENIKPDKICKIYGQILASLLKFHTNVEYLVQRILTNNIFNFEEIIKDDKFRVNFIRICLNNTFRVQNLKTVTDLMIPYYTRNNIPLEELLYGILYRYRHLKKTFVLKQFSSFKGLLDLNYKINLASRDFDYYFDYDEDEEDEEEEEEEEDEEEEEEEEEEQDQISSLTTPEGILVNIRATMDIRSIDNIKLGSLLMYFYMDTKYFNKENIEFVEDAEEIEKIKAFKEYYKIKDIK